jgi:cell wall-associated NlpC family hydrolase
VYAELLGIELPSYAGEQPDASEREEIAAMVAGEKGGWISCSTPRPFDLALFKIRGQVTHAGIVVTPELFLQNTRLRARASTIERFDHPFWRPKFEGFYRHPTLSE